MWMEIMMKNKDVFRFKNCSFIVVPKGFQPCSRCDGKNSDWIYLPRWRIIKCVWYISRCPSSKNKTDRMDRILQPQNNHTKLLRFQRIFKTEKKIQVVYIANHKANLVQQHHLF